MHFFHHVPAARFTCAMAMICLLVLMTSAALADSSPDRYSYDWFMQPDDSMPTKSCVYVSSREYPVLLMEDPSFESQYVWKVHFLIEEVTGIPFAIEKVTEVTFGAENAVLQANDYVGEEILMLLPCATAEAGNTLGFSVNIIPGGGETGFAIAVEGTDALGNALTFTSYVPLSYEVSDVITRAHFTCVEAQEEGKPYISIYTEQDPIPQIYNPAFAGDYGWEYFYTIVNDTDEPFTLTRILEAYIIGDAAVHVFEYGVEQFEEWGFPTAMTKDNPFCGGSGANAQQGFEYLGLRAEGVDKDGNEMVFTALIPFSQERPQQ